MVIHPLLPVFASVMLALGYIEQFFILLVLTFIHEAAHYAAGTVLLKRTLLRIRLVPIGQVLVFNDIDRLPITSKLIIYSSGAVVNILLSALLYAVSGSNDGLLTRVAETSLMLGLVNLIPAFPFDGASILHTITGNAIGIYNSNIIVKKAGRIFCGIVYCIGFIYLIFYPFNINIICIGIYFELMNKEEWSNMTAAYYRNMLRKSNRSDCSGSMPVRLHVTPSNTKVSDLLSRLCWDYYYVFFLLDGDVSKLTVTESMLIDYALNHAQDVPVAEIYSVSPKNLLHENMQI